MQPIQKGVSLPSPIGQKGKMLISNGQSLQFEDSFALPDGTNGQVLTKTSSGVAFQDVPKELPSNGANGQVLTKTSSGVAFQDVPKELPAFTSSNNGQVLGVQANRLAWIAQASGGGGSDNYPIEGTPIYDYDVAIIVGNIIDTDGYDYNIFGIRIFVSSSIVPALTASEPYAYMTVHDTYSTDAYRYVVGHDIVLNANDIITRKENNQAQVGIVSDEYEMFFNGETTTINSFNIRIIPIWRSNKPV